MSQFYQTPEILWELLGTRRCVGRFISVGTEFPYIPAEIKHWLYMDGQIKFKIQTLMYESFGYTKFYSVTAMLTELNLQNFNSLRLMDVKVIFNVRFTHVTMYNILYNCI